MKYMSVAVPCYNSQEYMKKCVDSLLTAKDDVEIIIINDGSHDKTGDIADAYAKEYPGTVKVIHQENSGHGEGVNRGLASSDGLYFKVVDSDDWVNPEAFEMLISKIKEHFTAGTSPDLYICNYVYEHSPDNSTYTMKYSNVFKENKITDWNETGKFKSAQCLMMHSVFFRTEFLKGVYSPLPKHTFFVDNLYMYAPLPYVKTLCYMNLDVYRYFIGRPDQSVNEKMMIKRIDQQIYVTTLMMKSHDLSKLRKNNKMLHKYMFHHLSMMMLINASFSFLSKDKEKIRNFYKLWKDIKKDDLYMYKRLKYSTSAFLTTLPGRLGRMLYVVGYRFAKKIVKFG